MNITLGSDNSVAVSRGEKITRGQSRSKLIKVNWRSNESPPELPISDAQHIAIEELVVQVNITRPDGEYSGWQDMMKIDGEIAFYYPLQKWDTEIPGKAQCQIRWFRAGEDGDDDDTTVYTSNQTGFIIDNGIIAQTLLPDLADYTTWQAMIAGLQNNTVRKYDCNALSVGGVVFNINGKKSAPAIYFNFDNGEFSGFLLVSKYSSGNNTIQTETLFSEFGIFARSISFATTDYNESSNDNPSGTTTEWKDITKRNFTESQLDALNSGITASKVAEIAGKVDKTRTIAGIDLQDNITKNELAEALGISPDLNIKNATGIDSIVQKYSRTIDATHQPNTNNGNNAAVFGYSNVNNNTGDRSILLGRYNTNSASNNLIAGQENTVNKHHNIVAGVDNMIEVGYSMVSGYQNTAGTESGYVYALIVTGRENNVQSSFSIVAGKENSTTVPEGVIICGYGNIADESHQILCGHYNKPTAFSLLSVGNGVSDANRSNAFEVLSTGVARAYGTPVGNYDLIRKIDLDNFVQKTQTIAELALSGNISAQDLTDSLVFATSSDINGLFD